MSSLEPAGRAWTKPSRGAQTFTNWMPVLPALIFLCVVILYPVGQLLLLSVQSGGSFSVDHYVRLFTSDIYVQVLLITIKIALLTTVISAIVSYPVAYLIATSGASAKSRLFFWVILPFWTSFLVRTFAWVVILGRNGVLNQLLQQAGIIDAPADLIYNLRAVIIGISHAMIPLCIMTMVSAMEGIDANLTRAASTLGARPGNVFWRIYFPLSVPGLAAAALLVFITAVGFFITPAFLGGRRETMITQIIIEQVIDLLNWPFAGVLSVLLLVAGLVIFAIYDRLLGLSSLSGSAARQLNTSSGKPTLLDRIGRAIVNALGNVTDFVARPFQVSSMGEASRRRFGLARFVLQVVVVVVLAFLCVPAFLMIPISFTDANVIDWPPTGFTFKWYETFFNSPAWVEATVRSFVVAFASAVLAMIIGVPAAFAFTRRQFLAKSAVLGIIMAPLIIPRIIIAVALFYFYSRIGLVGTYIGLIVGHAALAVPYVVVTMIAILKGYDSRYDQAAASLGGRPTRVLQHITLPILKGGLVSAFLFAFITSFDEVTVALFVTGGLNSTLPKRMWDDAILAVTPTIAVASTLLLVFVTLLIVITERVRKAQKA